MKRLLGSAAFLVISSSATAQHMGFASGGFERGLSPDLVYVGTWPGSALDGQAFWYPRPDRGSVKVHVYHESIYPGVPYELNNNPTGEQQFVAARSDAMPVFAGRSINIPNKHTWALICDFAATHDSEQLPATPLAFGSLTLGPGAGVTTGLVMNVYWDNETDPSDGYSRWACRRPGRSGRGWSPSGGTARTSPSTW